MRAGLPATILVLAATILFVIVTCSTPVIKSVAFLEATIGGQGSQSGQKAYLGCLGYCIGDTCKGPTVGYSFDPTQLLGVATSVKGISVNSSKYSTAVIKGLTYALILNPIALAACAATLLTGLIGLCGDCVMVCVNGVMSGIASGVALIAVAINFALFILAQKRINEIDGASASLGIALWLSLAGWICIVLSSCTFCCGCGGSSGRKSRKHMRDEPSDDAWKAPPSNNGGFGTAGRRNNNNAYGEQMRMDALRAESDRNRRHNDLPKFATFETEHVEALPLKQDYDDSFAHASSMRHGNAYGNGKPAYGNDFGYAYGDDSTFSHHNTGAAAYAAGVGPGAPRQGPQAAVGTYYDSAPTSLSNMAGHGAHQVTSPTPTEQRYDAYGNVLDTPMTGIHSVAGDGDYFYADGAAHPVPPIPAAAVMDDGHDRDVYGGYASNDYPDPEHTASQYPGQPTTSSSQYPGQPTTSQYPGQPSGSQSQYDDGQDPLYSNRGTGELRTEYDDMGHSYAHSSAVVDAQSPGGGGHPIEYSGATFGAAAGNGTQYGQSRSRTSSQHVGRTMSNASNSPYDAVQQATSAGRARRLPAVPSQGQEEIIYSPTSQHGHRPRDPSFGIGSIPPPRGKSGDDGFGVAVLQAGANAAAASGASQQQHQQQQQYYTDRRTSSPTGFDEPPQYNSPPSNPYGGTSSQHHYPSEKYYHR